MTTTTATPNTLTDLMFDRAIGQAYQTYPSGRVWDGKHFCGFLAHYGWVIDGWQTPRPGWFKVPGSPAQADLRRGEFVYDPDQAEAWTRYWGSIYSPSRQTLERFPV